MKKIIVLATALFVLLAGCTGTSEAAHEVAFVGEQPVAAEEYALWASDCIATVAQAYSAEYGADVNEPDFWTTALDGKTPIEELKEQANARMLREKGLQEFACKLGLLDDVSWSQFLQDLEKENNTRIEKKKNGEVVYGPETLTVKQFYSYRQSEIERAVKDYVSENLVEAEERELMERYQELYDQESRNKFSADLVFFQTEYSVDLDACMEAVTTLMELEIVPEDICRTVWEDTGIELSVHYQTLNSEEIGKDDFETQQIYAAVQGKEAGERSELLQIGGNAAVAFVEAIEYIPMESYSELEDIVRYLLLEEKAQAYVSSYVNGLPVRYTKTYDNLTIEQLR